MTTTNGRKRRRLADVYGPEWDRVRCRGDGVFTGGRSSLDPGNSRSPSWALAWLALDVWGLGPEQQSCPAPQRASWPMIPRAGSTHWIRTNPAGPIRYSRCCRPPKGQYDIALESSQRAVDLGPNDSEAWAERARVLTYAGQHDAGPAPRWRRRFELNPKTAGVVSMVYLARPAVLRRAV